MQKTISDGGKKEAAPGRWLLREWRRLGLWLPVAFGAGCIWFFLKNAPTTATNWLIAAGCFYVASWIGYRQHEQLVYGKSFIACWIAGLALGTFALGAGVAALRMPEIHTPVLKCTLEQTTLSGVVEDILVQPESLKIVLGELRIDPLRPEEKPKKIRITTRRYQMEALPDGSKKRQVHFDVGDRIILRATLFPPPPPASPGQFDYARHFYFKQIGAVGISNDRITVLKKATEASGWEGKLAQFRLHLSEKIRQQIGAQSGKWAEGAIANALMSGQQSTIPEEINEAMRVSGLTHVLSISGLHLSLAAGIVFISMRLLLLVLLPGRWRDGGAKKIAAIFALVSSVAYLAIAGFPIAAQRSYVMVAIVLLAVLLDRQAMGMRSIAVAALALLLWQPEAVLSSSFKLSFAATLAIIAWAEAGSGAIMRWRSNESIPPLIRTIVLYFGGAMMTSFVASTITAPLIMADFQQFNSYGVISNLLLSPLVSFWIMPLVVISFLALPFGLEAWPLQGLSWGITQMIDLAVWVASWPYASITTPPLTMLGTVLVVVGGLWLMLWRTRWLRMLGLSAIIAGVYLAYLAPMPHILLGRDGKQVAAILPDGNWRMMTGSARNLNAKQWLQAVRQTHYNQPTKNAPDAFCTAIQCRWEVAGRKVLLRFEPKPLKEYTPRTPKKPDSELTPAQLMRRKASQAKSAAKRAEKNTAILAERSGQLHEADAYARLLTSDDLVIDLRENAVRTGAAMHISQRDILESSGMKLWWDNGWKIATVAEQQGQWPWAISH